MNGYRSVLGAPVEVRNALRERKITTAAAEKIAFCDLATQSEIARRIRNGEDPKSVVAVMVDSRERWATLAALVDRLVKLTEDADESFRAFMASVEGASNTQGNRREAKPTQNDGADQSNPPGAAHALADAAPVKRSTSSEPPRG